MTGWWKVGDDGLTLSVRVTPGARRSEVVSTDGDRLRIKVAAPPVEGKANAEVVRFVAELFRVRRSAVSLVSGDHSRDKVLWVAGVEHPPPGLTAG